MRTHYQDWLRGQGYSSGTISSRIANAARVEEEYGDLDGHFDRDRFVTLISEFAYSSEDARRGRPNPSKIAINGDIRNGLASYRSAIALYANFRSGDGATTQLSQPLPDAPARIPARRAAKVGEPRGGSRTLVDFNLDGRAALEALLAGSQYQTVSQAVASLTLFSHPLTVSQTECKAIFPSIRNPRRVGQIDLHEGRRVLLDDNKTPTEAFLWANGLSRRGPDTQFNHVYATSLDVDAYTALPNICMTPAFIAKLTDTSSFVRSLLRFRSFQLYGWTPKGVEPPARPDEYESLEWATPLPAVPDVRVVIEAAMATKPKNRTVLAARQLGWLFGAPADEREEFGLKALIEKRRV